MPRICGMPPDVEHATFDQKSLVTEHATKGGAVKFEHPPIKYSCNKGYTLDASPWGSGYNNGAFELRCQASGQFEVAPVCMPVECGAPPDVMHSSFPGAGLRYPEEVTYSCDTGYSLTGHADGKKAFTVQCEAYGGYGASGGEGGEGGNMATCEIITCGEPKQIAKSNHPTAEMFYGHVVTGTCLNGYSTDTSASPTKFTYEIECKADGKTE